MYEALSFLIAQTVCRAWYLIESQARYQDYQICVVASHYDWESIQACIGAYAAEVGQLAAEYGQCW